MSALGELDEEEDVELYGVVEEDLEEEEKEWYGGRYMVPGECRKRPLSVVVGLRCCHPYQCPCFGGE